jgi:hypothetical protein
MRRLAKSRSGTRPLATECLFNPVAVLERDRACTASPDASRDAAASHTQSF